MCGRLKQDDPAALVEGWSGVRIVPTLTELGQVASANVAPTQNLLVLRQVDKAPEIVMARWGLIPSWSKDRRIAQRTFNARSETVAEKPSFRAALRRRRCVVLANGFYEWRSVAGRKVPYLFSSTGPLLLAGLWERWQDAEGEVLDTATILTCEARPPVSELHDRQPVLFSTRAKAEAWVHPSRTDSSELLPLLPLEGPTLVLTEALGMASARRRPLI